jgi:hypothetical protein
MKQGSKGKWNCAIDFVEGCPSPFFVVFDLGCWWSFVIFPLEQLARDIKKIGAGPLG